MIDNDFIKVRTYLTKGLYNSDGVKYSDEFADRLIDEEEKFRQDIILPINEEVGLHNWAIKFIEHPTDNPRFFADIYCDTDDYYKIVSIVKEKVSDVELQFYHKGDIATYKSNQ